MAVDASCTKETIKSIVTANHQEEGVLSGDDGKSSIITSGPRLTFEPQRELLMLKLELEKELEEKKSQSKQGGVQTDCPSRLSISTDFHTQPGASHSP